MTNWQFDNSVNAYRLFYNYAPFNFFGDLVVPFCFVVLCVVIGNVNKALDRDRMTERAVLLYSSFIFMFCYIAKAKWWHGAMKKLKI